MAKLKITLKKSMIGSTENVKASIKTLGIKKVNDTVIHENTPSVLGKIKKAQHLLLVEEEA